MSWLSNTNNYYPESAAGTTGTMIRRRSDGFIKEVLLIKIFKNDILTSLCQQLCKFRFWNVKKKKILNFEVGFLKSGRWKDTWGMRTNKFNTTQCLNMECSVACFPSQDYYCKVWAAVVKYNCQTRVISTHSQHSPELHAL